MKVPSSPTLLVAASAAIASVRATGLVGRICTYPTTAPQLPPVDCELYTVVSDPSPWGTCQPVDDYSKKYVRTKILGIKIEAANNGKACPGVDDPVRKVEEVCPPENCVPAQGTGTFGECKDVDGSGRFFKYKVLDVAIPEKNGGTCDEKDRTITEPCEAVNCVVKTPVEDTDPFGDCYADPDSTTTPPRWIKSKVLGIKTLASNGGTCPGIDDPIRQFSEVCPPVNCVPLTPEEDMEPYGSCELVDGKYVKSKVLGVKVKEQNGGTCDAKDRVFSVPCAAIDCVVNSEDEDTDPFGECKDLDGSNKFFQYKVLGIKSPAQFGGADCVPEAERTVKKFCAPVNCVPVAPEDDTNPFGNCTELPNTNKYFRYKVLDVKEKEQNGGTCDEKDRTISEFCAPVPCVVKTPTEDTGNFSACYRDPDSYTPKYIKSKVLEIKTPAENGGSCPDKTDPIRKYSEVCPPINCVPVSPANDTKPFGPCKKDPVTGKYFKEKILDVQTPEQNGGTCDKKDLKYSELCPPVDCVVNTPEEDKGEFGSCKKATDGQYYRTKVLGIKTLAQNGGSCPSEEKRTIKQLCPNDGYCLPSDAFYDMCIPKLAQCGAKITNKVYVGKTLNQITGLALWECCDKCATTPGCKAYTFLRDKNPKKTECLLKWEIDDTRNEYDDVVSSSPKTPKPTTCEFHDDRTLISITSKTLAKFDTNDLAFCCSKCQATRGCKAFEVSSDTCYLESQEGVRVWWPGARVGYV